MTGSLQIKNGRYYMVLELGNKKQKWKSTGLPEKNNKRRAEDMLKAAIREYEEQAAAQPTADISVADLVQEWLKIKQQEVRSNTYTSYEETATIHVIPYFGGKRLTAGQLTTAIIKQYYNEKIAEGLKPDSLARHRTILRGSLDYAIETLDILSVNPADRATLPKNTKKRVPAYYSADQLKRLFRAVEGESIEAPVKLSATYGLRRSEVLGLQWKAVDFQRKTVTISHTVVRNGTEVLRDDTVKEAASFRTMPLTPDMESFLRRLKGQQKELKKLCGKSWPDTGYICIWDDGRPLEPDYVTSRFNRFLREKGLPHIRFHDLRRSSATLLVNSGYTLEEVMKWLGHASIRSTERYAHLQAGSKNDMAKKVNKLLSLER